MYSDSLRENYNGSILQYGGEQGSGSGNEFIYRIYTEYRNTKYRIQISSSPKGDVSFQSTVSWFGGKEIETTLLLRKFYIINKLHNHKFYKYLVIIQNIFHNYKNII